MFVVLPKLCGPWLSTVTRKLLMVCTKGVLTEALSTWQLGLLHFKVVVVESPPPPPQAASNIDIASAARSRLIIGTMSA
jgi:hypothetical protein